MSSDDSTPVRPDDTPATAAGGPRTAWAEPPPKLAAADVHRLVGRLTRAPQPAPKPAPPAESRPGLPALDLAKELRQRVTAWRRRRLGLRGTLLYLLPLPLPLAGLVALASGDFGGAVAALGAFAAIVGGAYLNRRGLREQLLAPERRFSRPDTLPYGYLGAALVATGTGLAAGGVVGHDAFVSTTFALLAAVGFHLSYPLPSPRRLLERPVSAASDTRVRSALERAEGRILAIELAAEGIGNPELEQRLRRIAAQGRGILDLIAGRPGELSRAHKFLNVYLEGAERVASRYAQTHRVARSRTLESSFRNVLAEIEAVFERQRTLLLAHDMDDLDVQIEVLRKQLEREGLG